MPELEGLLVGGAFPGHPLVAEGPRLPLEVTKRFVAYKTFYPRLNHYAWLGKRFSKQDISLNDLFLRQKNNHYFTLAVARPFWPWPDTP